MTETQKDKGISQSIKKYGKQLLSFISGKVSVVEDAEDILQEVWYQFSKLSNFDEIENVSSWLYAVSRNKIIDFYRKQKTDNLEDFVYEDEDGSFSIKDILLLDDSQNPELQLFKDAFWNELLLALNELPENQKEVFILNEIEDKTLQEIANEKNENLKTIISRKGYATKHLRKKLQHFYKEFLS